MWPVFDPDLVRQLATIRELVGLTHQTPIREWPLLVVDEHDALFVVREWPDGSITAYATGAASAPEPPVRD